MQPFDAYEAYRHTFTEEERGRLKLAGEKLAKEAEEARAAGETVVEGGYRDEKGRFLPNALTREYARIAADYAQKQFSGWPTMPEDEQTDERLPAVDPVGKYSIIDMEMEERLAKVRAAMASRSPAVRDYAQSLLELERSDDTVRQLRADMDKASMLHRRYARASKLSPDAVTRRYLHEKSCELRVSADVVKYNKYLQGIEYAAGVRTGPVPQEVLDFYSTELHRTLDQDRVLEAADLYAQPREIHVEFENLDNKFQQRDFANPRCWGKKPGEIERTENPRLDRMVSPYARATAERVLDPLFGRTEDLWGDQDYKANPINRGTHIIIDGKTVREKLLEDFMAIPGSRMRDFDTFYKDNYRQKTGEYVAAALMAGKRVEAFVPDRNGRIPDEPVQITKTGYEPSPLNKVTLNAWQRFASKLGFYKEKVAKAAEYQRMIDARERVKAGNLASALEADVEAGAQRKQFFGAQIAAGTMPEKVPGGFSATRLVLSTVATCAMAEAGYPVEEIFDPTKLTEEKQRVGEAVLRNMTNGNIEWTANTLFSGQRRLVEYLDEAATRLRLTEDERSLFRPENRTLFNVAHTLFDANQECAHCKQEYAAAAMSALPEGERTPENGAKLVNEVMDRSNCLAGFFHFARKSLRARCDMADGLLPTSGAIEPLSQVVGFEEGRRELSERMWGGDPARGEPLRPLSYCATEEELPIVFGRSDLVMYDDATYRHLQDTLDSSMSERKNFGNGLISGWMQKRMKIEKVTQLVKNKEGKRVEEERYSFKLLSSDEKTNKREAKKTAPQEPARKDAAKAPGGRTR